MSERKGFKPMLASLMAMAGMDPMRLPASAGMLPRKFRSHRTGKRKHNGRNKPLFTMGYRGFPRRMNRMPFTAPTIDQVRKIERQHKIRIWVKEGLMYYKGTGKLFDRKHHAT